MPIDEALAAIIICPDCRGSLVETAHDGVEELTCQGCGLIYPIRDGIPVLLVDEATRHE